MFFIRRSLLVLRDGYRNCPSGVMSSCFGTGAVANCCNALLDFFVPLVKTIEHCIWSILHHAYSRLM